MCVGGGEGGIFITVVNANSLVEGLLKQDDEIVAIGHCRLRQCTLAEAQAILDDVVGVDNVHMIIARPPHRMAETDARQAVNAGRGRFILSTPLRYRGDGDGDANEGESSAPPAPQKSSIYSSTFSLSEFDV